ncbi:tripeptidyl-peptidase-like protein [Xylariales sp. AK1849]|nr:tripeptidyl-peptidase-like protein [Xylariales sp. AK1849]
MRFLVCALSFLALARAEVATVPTRRHELPPGWKHMKTAHADEGIDLSIELRQPHLSELKTRLAAISDPTYVDYGRHLTKEEVEEYQTPDQHAVRLVISWLNGEGIHDARIEGPSIRFRSSVKTLRTLLDTDVGHYSFGRFTYLRARSYSIPHHLDAHVRFVHPLSHFAKPVGVRTEALRQVRRAPPNRAARRDTVRRHASYTSYKLPSQKTQGQSNQSQPCADGVSPGCLRRLFHLPTLNHTGAHLGTSKVRFGVAGFLDQWAHYDDVSSFMQKYAPSIQSTGFNFTVQLVENGTNPQSPKEMAGLEASLDLEYAMALGYPSNVKYYATGGRAPSIGDNGTQITSEDSGNEPFLEFLQYMLDLSDDEIPHVLSISYSDDEDSVPWEYATKVCDMFAQVAARGVSVFVSSGDGGATGTSMGDCYSNDGQYRKMFIPTFPPSCPYVTVVGATKSTLPLEGSVLSGGGFSNYFSTPDWQRHASAEYLAALNVNGTNQSFYNATGRAIPDLSAPGEMFAVMAGGQETTVSGTSASTPVVAALIALVNEERFKAGKNSLGWLNPLLYTPKVRAALVDVSVGSNLGCTYGNTTVPGFEAYKGYDCVSGLGSVGTFDRLLQALG